MEIFVGWRRFGGEVWKLVFRLPIHCPFKQQKRLGADGEMGFSLAETHCAAFQAALYSQQQATLGSLRSEAKNKLANQTKMLKQNKRADAN